MIATASQKSGYKALPLAGLVPNALPPVDLYLPEDNHAIGKLYRSAGIPVQARDLASLRARGIAELWVVASDYDQIHAFLSNNLASLLSDESHPPVERLRLLNQVVSETLRDTFTTADVEQKVSATRELAAHVVDMGLRSEIAIQDVAKVAKHDFCTFTHSANVACYATFLAREIGISDTDELRAIAAGGMLHDLGKLEIPNRILCKAGRLTEDEFALVKLHPTRGFQVLRRQGGLSAAQLMMVYQHHERMDGAGYPVGCVGAEIHPWARLCAVVDVFEALTGKRPYRRANSTQESLSIMDRGAGTHFDLDFFRCWRGHLAQETKT